MTASTRNSLSLGDVRSEAEKSTRVVLPDSNAVRRDGLPEKGESR